MQRKRRRRDFQAHPSGPPPPTISPALPGEEVAAHRPFSPPQRLLAGDRHLLPRQRDGQCWRRVAVKELFEPPCLCKRGFNVKPCGCLFIHIRFFSVAPLEYTTMISSLSLGEYIYIYISKNFSFVFS